MANKKFSDLTAATTVAKGSYIAIENESGNSRKVLAELAGVAFGTSFPGSPASGDRFYRTDRNIGYFYDGTRWLSTQLFTVDLVPTDDTLPYTATAATHKTRQVPLWVDTYSLYIVDLHYWYLLSGTGNWDVTVRDQTGVYVTLSGLTATSNTNGVSSVNALRTTGQIDYVYYTVTENSGTASFYFNGTVTYRLVG